MFNSRKAQIASYDVAIAIVVFTLLFGTFNIYYNQNLETFEKDIKLREMRALSEQALDILLTSKGIPGNWSASDVNVLGLSSKPFVIDAKKLSALQSMPYNTIKEKILFGRYDFLLEFKNKAGTISIGLQPQDTNYLKVKITSLASYAGAGTNVEFTAYE